MRRSPDILLRIGGVGAAIAGGWAAFRDVPIAFAETPTPTRTPTLSALQQARATNTAIRLAADETGEINRLQAERDRMLGTPGPEPTVRPLPTARPDYVIMPSKDFDNFVTGMVVLQVDAKMAEIEAERAIERAALEQARRETAQAKRELEGAQRSITELARQTPNPLALIAGAVGVFVAGMGSAFAAGVFSERAQRIQLRAARAVGRFPQNPPNPPAANP